MSSLSSRLRSSKTKREGEQTKSRPKFRPKPRAKPVPPKARKIESKTAFAQSVKPEEERPRRTRSTSLKKQHLQNQPGIKKEPTITEDTFNSSVSPPPRQVIAHKPSKKQSESKKLAPKANDKVQSLLTSEKNEERTKEDSNNNKIKSSEVENMGKEVGNKVPLTRRPWREVKDLWQPEDDPFAPLTLPFVPESYLKLDSNLTEIFKGHTGIDDESTKAVLLQLPKILPFKEEQAVQKADTQIKMETNQGNLRRGTTTAEEQSIFNGMKPGKIGKVRVHKSGRTTMVIGENIFELRPSFNCSFYEEICGINIENRSLLCVSEVEGKILCTPNIEHVLQSCRHATVKASSRTQNR